VNVYEAIAARRTIRDFEHREIDGKTLVRILSAGMQAPSHDHLREWHFVLIADARLRCDLARPLLVERTHGELEEMLDGWGMTDERQRAMYLDGIPKQVRMLVGAGALIIPCFRQDGPLLGEKRSLHELNAFAAIWAALENILVASASEGIFGVTKIISSTEERDRIRAMLGVPEDYEVPCFVALGYPAEGASWIEQLSVDVSERIHTNRWEDPSDSSV